MPTFNLPVLILGTKTKEIMEKGLKDECTKILNEILYTIMVSGKYL
jgi:hypothetical protein